MGIAQPNTMPGGGVGQVDVLSSLLQQAQQLQTLQQQLAATTAVESDSQPVFNTVSEEYNVILSTDCVCVLAGSVGQ